MESWDDEEFEPANVSIEPVVTDKWDGEDEDDDDIKDNWDDDDEGNREKDESALTQAETKKKKKPLAERIKEKQEKRKQELQAKEEEMKRAEEKNRELTPDEALAEKLRVQKLQEESDLELAKEAFGVTDPLPGVKTIDSFEPVSKADFTELENMIVQKLTTYEGTNEYSFFLENLFRDCCAGVEAEDIKRISNTLNILATEKLKLTKAAAKGKKKVATKNKSTLVVGKATRANDMDFDDDYYNDYGDFM